MFHSMASVIEWPIDAAAPCLGGCKVDSKGKPKCKASCGEGVKKSEQSIAPIRRSCEIF